MKVNRSRIEISGLQITSSFLFFLQSFKERLEVTFAETLGALALDDFEKEGRPVFDRLGENLEQITFVIAIDQNAKMRERSKVFIDVADAFRQGIVIGGRDL